jgi:hypothetical protein
MTEYYDTDEMSPVEQECVDAILDNAEILLHDADNEYLAAMRREDDQVEIDVWNKDFGSPQGILLSRASAIELYDFLQAYLGDDV